jgi:asparagine synthetase B (glutamine-hydrolysing)
MIPVFRGGFFPSATNSYAEELKERLCEGGGRKYSLERGFLFLRNDSAATVFHGDVTTMEIKSPDNCSFVMKFDSGKNTVLFSRKGLAAMQVYYAFHERSLLFSSSLRFLAGIMYNVSTLNTQLDENALDLSLKLGFTPSPGTLFRGIFKMGVYEACEIDIIEQKVKYVPAGLTSPAVVNAVSDDDKETNEFILMLQSTLKEGASGPDTGWSLMLSGGVDSSLLAFCIPPSKRFAACVIDYGMGKKDETAASKSTACRAALPLDIVILPPFSADALEKYCSLLEEPCGDTAVFCLMAIADCLDSDIGLITGFGADILAGSTSRQLKLKAAAPGLPRDVVLREELFIERQFFPEGCFSPVRGLLANMGRKNMHPYLDPDLFSYFRGHFMKDGLTFSNGKNVLMKALNRLDPHYEPPASKLGLGIPLDEWLFEKPDEIGKLICGLSYYRELAADILKNRGRYGTTERYKATQSLWMIILTDKWLKDISR